MEEKITFLKRFKSDPLTHLIGFWAIIYGVLLAIMQTTKFFRPDAAELEMLEMPIGLFDWGFVWSDTIIMVPLLLAGGVLILWRSRNHLGQLLAFSGFAINLYAIGTLAIGLQRAGDPLSAGELTINIFVALLGLLCMIRIAVLAWRRSRNHLERNTS